MANDTLLLLGDIAIDYLIHYTNHSSIETLCNHHKSSKRKIRGKQRQRRGLYGMHTLLGIQMAKYDLSVFRRGHLILLLLSDVCLMWQLDKYGVFHISSVGIASNRAADKRGHGYLQ